MIGLLVVTTAEARRRYDITGGRVWEDRVGPGIMGTVGANGCDNGFCQNEWDTRFWGSFGSSVAFFYRFIPNFVLLGEMHFGFLNTHRRNYPDQRSFLLQTTVAGEFHLPFFNWLAAYWGLGLGYVYLGMWSDNPHDPRFDDVHVGLHGLNFEFRTGADFYPWRKVPNLGIGPFLRVGVPLWLRECHDGQGERIEGCIGAADISYRRDVLPVLYTAGGAIKYSF